MKIKETTDSETIKAIYRLRCEVFAQNMEREGIKYTFFDGLDELASHVYCESYGGLIGAFRYFVVDNDNYSNTIYDLLEDEDTKSQKHIFFNKFVLKKSYKTPLVYFSLAYIVFKISLKKGIDFCHIEVAQEMASFFVKQGFRIKTTVIKDNKVYVQLKLRVNDSYYLKSIKSPLFKVLNQYLKEQIKQTSKAA